MKRIKNLGRYQKIILLLMFIMVLAFTVLYSITIAQEGYAYNNAILIKNQENGNTIYSGEIQGKQASFIVSADKIVKFQYGDKVYGPYTAKEDSTAIPKDCDMSESMTGIELCCGKEIIFRGGVAKFEDYFLIYNEDGSSANLDSHGIITNAIVMDENGDIIDPIEPSVYTIFDLMAGPKLTHKGTWLGWFGGVAICFITIITILFADELFRLNLAFRIRNVDHAEPSDWEIVSRYIGWTVLPIVALVVFLIGLR